MDKDTIAKYVAVALLLGSVLGLVALGIVKDAGVYVNLVNNCLIGLGIGAAVAYKAVSPPAPAPVTAPEPKPADPAVKA